MERTRTSFSDSELKTDVDQKVLSLQDGAGRFLSVDIGSQTDASWFYFHFGLRDVHLWRFPIYLSELMEGRGDVETFIEQKTAYGESSSEDVP